MATAQVTDTDNLDSKLLLRTLVAVKKGNFRVRMPLDQTGTIGKIYDTLNDVIELNERMAEELDRISTVVGKDGKISQRATIGNAGGSWSECVDSVNTLITDLVQPTSQTARVIRAVANGDLSQTIELEIEGRPLKGEGLVGQCTLERERILITEVPENYIKISSGLGEATPLKTNEELEEKARLLSLQNTEVERKNREIDQARLPKAQSGDRMLLIVEDDINFARILLDMAREQGFKGIVAVSGSTGLALAREFKPDAITLDIRLPMMDGWTVLDRLKHDPSTRHIPVHIVSVEEGKQRSLQQGAIAYLQKPVNRDDLVNALKQMKGFVERKVKNLLVVEDDEIQRNSIVELIGNSDVSTTAVSNGQEALTALKAGQFDCLVLDLGLPDMTGFELIEQIKQEKSLDKLPIIIYTGKDLTQQEETQLKRISKSIIIKDVRSPERLLDETALFLHRIQANLPQTKQKMLERLHQTDNVLAGKKVLIVDDDVRNIFALTSMLERYQMKVEG